MKFDGKAFAKEIEEQVRNKVTNLPASKAGLVTKPKIVSVLIGDDPASALYTKLKKAAAQRVGIEFEIVRFESEFGDNKNQDLGSRIKEIGERDDVTGLMIQLPIPGLQDRALKDVLIEIPFSKDVDGLRYPESGVVPPVVDGVLKIIDKIEDPANLKAGKYVVIGATGFVGSALCRELEERGLLVLKVDSETKNSADVIMRGDVIISCVGKEGIISGDMIRDNRIVIDVGSPLGDMTREVYQKASVSVEVPGGVGPVTIACLMANAVDIYGRNK